MSDTEERITENVRRVADAERVPAAASSCAPVLVAACRLRRPPTLEQHHEFHHPLDRVTGRLPRRLRIAVDWIVTIVGAVAIVLAIKAWVVNPYRIPSSSMESTLHCARPAPGCESRFSDRVLANRFVYHFRDPERGDVIVFETPPAAQAKCGAGGTFVKRIIGLPGERVAIRLRRGAAFVYIDGKRLEEPYIENDRRDIGPEDTYRVPAGQLLRHGRQPLAVVRLARVGLGSRGQPHRQGLHDLLAASADLLSLSSAQDRDPLARIPGRARSLKASASRPRRAATEPRPDRGIPLPCTGLSGPSFLMNTTIESLEQRNMRTDLPQFKAGDTLRVHFKVIEGNRQRIQVFEGICIKRQGSGFRETFTVRKQSFGVGVERTFPLHSPKIEKLEVAAIGDVRRAKLYYLRKRVGKKARVRELRQS